MEIGILVVMEGDKNLVGKPTKWGNFCWWWDEE